ncbi:hypothetical protein V9T40_008232 [Parthenolecanium corni]|uniref:Uncharacterized protein n=1 Tax=Parthenolecanium corni TaxID=536013 RepID=A0AAN9TMQ7_9HEMI
MDDRRCGRCPTKMTDNRRAAGTEANIFGRPGIGRVAQQQHQHQHQQQPPHSDAPSYASRSRRYTRADTRSRYFVFVFFRPSAPSPAQPSPAQIELLSQPRRLDDATTPQSVTFTLSWEPSVLAFALILIQTDNKRRVASRRTRMNYGVAVAVAVATRSSHDHDHDHERKG